MLTITPCQSPEDFAAAIVLTRDYLAWLDLDLSFQDLDKEFAQFSVMYGSPEGLFLLARDGAKVAGAK